MRRARRFGALVALLLAFCPLRAAHTAPSVTRMSGIGLLDYTRKPSFKTGDYVRYLVTTDLEDGSTPTSFVMTVLVASQEMWWGEPCFYLETWVDKGKNMKVFTATLVSYSIFDDSLAEDHSNLYLRKTVMDSGNEETPFNEILITPRIASLISRNPPSAPHTTKRDTVGPDTVQTPAGLLKAIKVVTHQAWGKSGTLGDSTLHREIHEERMQWFSNQVPMTGFALEVSKNDETRKTWFIGRSKEAPDAQRMTASTITARLLEYGHGLKSQVLPADRVHSFDNPSVGAKPSVRAKPSAAAKPKAASGAARKP